MIKTSLEIVQDKYATLFSRIEADYRHMFSFLKSRGFSEQDLNFVRANSGTRTVYETVSSLGNNFDIKEFMEEYRLQKQKQAGVINGNVIILDAYRVGERFQFSSGHDNLFGRNGKIVRHGVIVPLASAASILLGLYFGTSNSSAYASTQEKTDKEGGITYQDAIAFEQAYKGILYEKTKDGILDPDEITTLLNFLESQKSLQDISTASGNDILALKRKTIDSWKRTDLEAAKKIQGLIETLDSEIIRNYPGLAVGKRTYIAQLENLKGKTYKIINRTDLTNADRFQTILNTIDEAIREAYQDLLGNHKHPITGINYDSHRELSPTEKAFLEGQIELYNSFDGVRHIDLDGTANIEFLIKSILTMHESIDILGNKEPIIKLTNTIFSIPEDKALLRELQKQKEEWLNSDLYKGNYWFAGVYHLIDGPYWSSESSGKLEKLIKDYTGEKIKLEDLGVKYPRHSTKLNPWLGLALSSSIPIVRKLLVLHYVDRRWDGWDTAGILINSVGGLIIDSYHPWVFPARLFGAFYIIEPLRTATNFRTKK